jgi:MOSC domain-containing protein YiiM
MESKPAVVEAVCIRHRWLPEPDGGLTAIDKRPVPGRVVVTPLGLAGDAVGDTRHHGGTEQAVYAFTAEEAKWWAGELGREIPPGLFGENLRTSGIDLDALAIGTRIAVGEGGLVLAVAGPRVPCATFARRMDEPHWVRRFTVRGLTGAYLKVVTPGDVAAGDTIRVLAGGPGEDAPSVSAVFRSRFPARD